MPLARLLTRGSEGGATLNDMKQSPHEGGRIALRREGELLSDVVIETEAQIFRDEKLIVHLGRVAAAENVLLGDREGWS